MAALASLAAVNANVTSTVEGGSLFVVSIELAAATTVASSLEFVVEASAGEVGIRGGGDDGVGATRIVAVQAAGSEHRVVSVAAASTVSLRDVALEGGVAIPTTELVTSDVGGFGGCLYVGLAATVRASRTTFRHCSAFMGGGIFAETDARLVLVGSTVAWCEATAIGAGMFTGGAYLNVTGGSRIHDNVAGTGGAGVGGTEQDPWRWGGAMEVSDTVFARNVAAAFGGAIFSAALTPIHIERTVIANCTAGLLGAGIFFHPDDGNTVTDTDLVGCVCAGTDAYASGAAVHQFRRPPVPSTTVYTNVRILRCHHGNAGGGIGCSFDQRVVLTNCEIRDCTAGAHGGAASLGGHSVLDAGTRVERCSAARGGGLSLAYESTSVRLVDAHVAENLAEGTTGGGGIFLGKSTILELVRTTIFHNAAPSGIGGGVAAREAKLWVMAGTVIRGNTAAMGAGVAFAVGLRAGLGKGRLYASGPSCTFVEFTLDFEAATEDPELSFGLLTTTTTANTTTNDDADDGGSAGTTTDLTGLLFPQTTNNNPVDVRGLSTLVIAVAGARVTREACLAPARTYEVHLSAVRGLGIEWNGAVASVVGPPARMDPNRNKAVGTTALLFGVPENSWQRRFGTHASFRVGAPVGARPLFEANVATGRGGGILLADRAEAYLVDVAIAANVALGSDGFAGGGAFLDTSTLLDGRGCTFAGNSAPAGPGGVLHVTADTIVRLTDVNATANAAAEGGGFGRFVGAALLDVDGAVFRGNRVLRTGIQQVGGGALSLDGVVHANVRDATFGANVVDAMSADGGAVETTDSSLVLDGVHFHGNQATLGNGGGIAVRGGAVSFVGAASSSRCTTTATVVVDYRTTAYNCTQGIVAAIPASCDYVGGRCGAGPPFTGSNPYVGNGTTVPYCGGCACPFEKLKYFSVTDAATGEAVAADEALHPVGVSPGQRWYTGGANGVVPWTFCLEAGASYTIQAFDTLGEGWWGASLTVLVREAGSFGTTATTTTMLMPAWSGNTSAPMHVAVAPAVAAPSHFVANRAPEGGGGGLYWGLLGGFATRPDGFDDGAVVFAENVAAYGVDVATDAAELRAENYVAKNETTRSGHLVIRLYDAYDTIISTSLTVVIADDIMARNQILERGEAHFKEFVVVVVSNAPSSDDDNATMTATSNTTLTTTSTFTGGGSLAFRFTTAFSTPALDLASPTVSMLCAAGYRPDADLTCVACNVDEYYDDDGGSGVGRCATCEPGMVCGIGTALEERLLENVGARDGWWRATPEAWKFYECPFGRDGCQAGAVTGLAACHAGYRGPACSVCVPSYYSDSLRHACRRCRGGSRLVVILIFLVLAIIVVVLLWLSVRWVKNNQVKKLARYLAYDYNKPRLMIVYATAQILASVENALSLSFPGPFRHLLAAMNIFSFRLNLLPVACIASYGHYMELLWATVLPLGVQVVLAMLGAARRARFAWHDLEGRARISSMHNKLHLGIVFVLCPTSSATILITLQSCVKYQEAWPDGYLRADLSKRCGTPQHTLWVAYAACMVAVIPLGWPLCLILFLHKHRRLVNPHAKDQINCVRHRDADPVLKRHGLQILYSDFQPQMLYAGPTELYRRIFFIAVLPFCGEDAVRAFIGTILALVSLFVHRELMPFLDYHTNLLAYFATFVVFAVYLGAFIIVSRPFGYNDTWLGLMLLVPTIALFVFCAVYLTHSGRLQREAQMLQFEYDLRSHEAFADLALIRRERTALREKYEPEKVARESEAQNVVDLAAVGGPLIRSVVKTVRQHRSVSSPAHLSSSSRDRRPDRAQNDATVPDDQHQQMLNPSLSTEPPLTPTTPSSQPPPTRRATGGSVTPPPMIGPGSSFSDCSVNSSKSSLVTLATTKSALESFRATGHVIGVGQASSNADAITFNRTKYPCYVVPLSTLQTYGVLPIHEMALLRKEIEILTPLSTAPNSASSYFISQNWESYGATPHPDNHRHTKLKWLKNLKRHMGLTKLDGELWIWWDLVSVPQRNKVQQKLAIASLCAYTQLCSRFIPLVRDPAAWRDMYGEDIERDPAQPAAGALATYLSRAWCRLEMVAALAPKRLPSGKWRPGPRSMDFRYHQDPEDDGVGPFLSPELLRNPVEGIFSVASDIDVIEPVLVCIADRYAEYERSHSDAWDETFDVKGRPEWLRALADAHRTPTFGGRPSFDRRRGASAIISSIPLLPLSILPRRSYSGSSHNNQQTHRSDPDHNNQQTHRSDSDTDSDSPLDSSFVRTNRKSDHSVRSPPATARRYKVAPLATADVEAPPSDDAPVTARVRML